MALQPLVFFFFEQSGTEVVPPPSFDGQYMGPGVHAFFDGYAASEAPEPLPGPGGGWLPEDIEEQKRRARRKEREQLRKEGLRAFMEKVADRILGTEAEPAMLAAVQPFISEEAQPSPELPLLPALDLEALAQSVETIEALQVMIEVMIEDEHRREEEALIVLLMET